MIINPNNVVNGKYNLNYLKNDRSKIFAPIELNYNIYGLIQKHSGKLENFGYNYNLPVKFAPKGNSTLMNTGMYTTIFDNNITEDQFLKQLDEQFAKTKHWYEFGSNDDALSKRLRWAENIVSKLEKLLKIKI